MKQQEYDLLKKIVVKEITKNWNYTRYGVKQAIEKGTLRVLINELPECANHINQTLGADIAEKFIKECEKIAWFAAKK